MSADLFRRVEQEVRIQRVIAPDRRHTRTGTIEALLTEALDVRDAKRVGTTETRGARDARIDLQELLGSIRRG